MILTLDKTVTGQKKNLSLLMPIDREVKEVHIVSQKEDTLKSNPKLIDFDTANPYQSIHYASELA